jgi:hypothetical protein
MQNTIDENGTVFLALQYVKNARRSRWSQNAAEAGASQYE